MDWKQFIASVVGSISWPAAIVLIVLIFKDQLRLLIGHIKKIGAAGVNLELSEKIDEAVDAGEIVETEKGVVAPNLAGLDPTLLELAKSFPEAALLQAFKELEALILEVRKRIPQDRPYKNLYEVLKELVQLELIPASALALFQSLRAARNAAAHGKSDDLSSNEALSLIQQIKLLQNVIAPALDQLPLPSARISI